MAVWTPERTQLEPGLDLVFIGGNSERARAMRLGVEVLGSTGFFNDIFPMTINQADSRKGQRRLRAAAAAGEKVIFGGHSMGLSRVERGYQAFGINPAEPITFKQQVDGGQRILKNQITPEPGAHETGALDMLGAIWQQGSSPITTGRTMMWLNGGSYSSVEHLSDREAFPGGAVIIHADNDTFTEGFGFTELATTPRNLRIARAAGTVIKVVEGDFGHNSWLFEPRRVLNAAGTDVLPQDALDRMNAAA